MAMKENFISMAPDEESSAKVSLIDQNKTLMIDQYTTDVEAGAPEFVEDVHNIEDAFAHFKPKVEVSFTDAEGGSVGETLILVSCATLRLRAVKVNWFKIVLSSQELRRKSTLIRRFARVSSRIVNFVIF